MNKVFSECDNEIKIKKNVVHGIKTLFLFVASALREENRGVRIIRRTLLTQIFILLLANYICVFCWFQMIE